MPGLDALQKRTLEHSMQGAGLSRSQAKGEPGHECQCGGACGPACQCASQGHSHTQAQREAQRG